MNYYEARQVDPNADRPDAGKWRYTNEHYRQGLLDDIDFDGKWADTHYQCEAVTTRDKIRVGFAELPEPVPESLRCQQWTDGFASLGPGHMVTFNLCPHHRTREVVSALYPTVGSSFGSY